jgi:hypothetical protein
MVSVKTNGPLLLSAERAEKLDRALATRRERINLFPPYPAIGQIVKHGSEGGIVPVNYYFVCAPPRNALVDLATVVGILAGLITIAQAFETPCRRR